MPSHTEIKCQAYMLPCDILARLCWAFGDTFQTRFPYGRGAGRVFSAVQASAGEGLPWGAETDRNLANKVGRSGFTAFFIQCLSAIGCTSLRLEDA